MFEKVTDCLGKGFDFQVNDYYVKVRENKEVNLVISKDYENKLYEVNLYIPYRDETVYKTSRDIIANLQNEEILGSDFEYNKIKDFVEYTKNNLRQQFNYRIGKGQIYFNGIENLKYDPIGWEPKFAEGAVGTFLFLCIGAGLASPIMSIPGGMGIMIYHMGAAIAAEYGKDIPTLCSLVHKGTHKIKNYFYKKKRNFKNKSSSFKQVHILNEKIQHLNELIEKTESLKEYKTLIKTLEQEEKKMEKYFKNINNFAKNIPGVVISYSSKNEEDVDNFVYLALNVKEGNDVDKLNKKELVDYKICKTW
jgi:hypothetical protein